MGGGAGLGAVEHADNSEIIKMQSTKAIRKIAEREGIGFFSVFVPLADVCFCLIFLFFDLIMI